MARSFFAWRVDGHGHKSLLDVENQGVYRPELYLCWHVQASPAQREDPRLIATRGMQKNVLTNEDAPCFVTVADLRVL